MRYKEPYTLFKKTLKSGTQIWYYMYYDEYGRRRQISTGQTRKIIAEKIALKKFYNGEMFPNVPYDRNMETEQNELPGQRTISDYGQIGILPKKHQSPLIKDYLEKWFVYGECNYIRQRHLHGFHLTEFYASRRRFDVEKRIIPYFGKYRLNELNEKLFDEWINYMVKKEKLSNATVNKTLKTLKIILSEALRLGDITEDLSKKIRLLKNNSKAHGIFTENEVNELFNRKKINDYWNGHLVFYGMNYLASRTGMRLGEVQALQKENVFDDHLLIEHGWNEKTGIRDTKTHKSRIIPISKEVYELLKEIECLQTKGTYLFSVNQGVTPATRTDMNKHFHRALERIGISHEERLERYLSFHSWRHYLNSKLVNSGIPISVVQSIIGHVNDDAMTEHYTHVSLEEMKKVLDYI